MYQYSPQGYQEARRDEMIPVGKYRVRIKDIERLTSLSGKEMAKLTFDVSGKTQSIIYFLVYMTGSAEEKKRTDAKVGKILECFGLNPNEPYPGDNALIGKVGAIQVKEEIYNEEPRAAVHYFIPRAGQASLPAWSEPGFKAASAQLEPVDKNDDLPF